LNSKESRGSDDELPAVQEPPVTAGCGCVIA
jgi:hypothetical protein